MSLLLPPYNTHTIITSSAEIYHEIAQLPTLTQESFFEWLWNLNRILELAEVFETLFQVDPDSEKRPEKPTPADELKEWNSAQKLACRIIVKAAGRDNDTLTSSFHKKSDAIGMYDAIVDHYAKKNVPARFRCFNELVNLKENPDMTWKDFCGAIGDKVDHLKKMNPDKGYDLSKLYDELKLFTLLVNLP